MRPSNTTHVTEYWQRSGMDEAGDDGDRRFEVSCSLGRVHGG